jgi:hypothetical protein
MAALPPSAWRGIGVLLAAVPAAGGMAVLRDRKRVPELEITDGGFATPRGPGALYGALALLAILAATVVLGRAEVAGLTAHLAWLILLAVPAAALAFVVRGAWRGTGVTLTPAGVRVDAYHRRVFTPWDEFSGDTRLVFSGTEPGFLVAVLRHYVAHPEDRASIGTDTGYQVVRDLPTATDIRRALPLRDKVLGTVLLVSSPVLWLWTSAVLDPYGAIQSMSAIAGLLGWAGLSLLIPLVNEKQPPVVLDEAPPPPPRPAWSRDVTQNGL